jgi:hypothetical protein
MANDTHAAERLKQLHQRIEQWRLTRRQHGPMPGELWDEATALARSLGVSQVARALGLGYTSLQQRVRGGSELRAVATPASASGFVEIHRTLLLGAPTAGSSQAEALVEVVAGDGARLTLRLPAHLALDVAGLIAAFRGNQP